MLRLGINGFGRIGRSLLRAAHGNPNLEVVAVNDLTDAATLAYLLKRDSILGPFPAPVGSSDGSLLVDGKPVRVFAQREPANIPWSDAGVDIVVEATGRFTDKAQALAHVQGGGAKRVIVSAPAKGDDLTIVMGVNHGLYDPAVHVVVSNGSCTTNALAPLAMVLHQRLGIQHGQMVTTHAYTNSQALHDQPSKELRAGRAAALSIIPHSTGGGQGHRQSPARARRPPCRLLPASTSSSGLGGRPHGAGRTRDGRSVGERRLPRGGGQSRPFGDPRLQ